MAIAVSQAYKDAQAQRGGKRARILVQYKRRYFDAATVAYVYEANWHVLTQRDFVDPGEIVDQLDVQEPNVFKSTTVTLRLNNSDNRWIKSVNDPSIFAGDAVAPNGYDDYGTIFQLLKGFQLADGTWEDWPQFTGYAFDFTPLPAQGYIEIPVSASLLADKCAATEVNVAVTGEGFGISKAAEVLSPSTGDGTAAILKTGSTAVIRVANVYADGVAMVAGTDYTVSISADNQPAAITLVSPATWNRKTFTADLVTKDLLTISTGVVSIDSVYANGTALSQGRDYTVSIPTTATAATVSLTDATVYIGATLTWSGTKGVQNLAVDAAVALLCDAAGIPPTMRAIQPVIFAGGVAGKITLDTEADWETGSLLQNVSTTSIVGSLLQKWFTVDDFSGSLSRWYYEGGFASIASGQLRLTGIGYMATSMLGAVGSWQFTISGPSSNRLSFIFVNDSNVSISYSLDFYAGQIILLKNEDQSSPLASAACSIATQRSIRITRDSNGKMMVYVDGVFVMQATDNSNTVTTELEISTQYSVSAFFYLGPIYYSNDVDSTTVMPPAASVAEYQYNLYSVAAALGTLDYDYVLNGGSVLFETATAPDSGGIPGTWEAYKALGPSNQIQSTPNQWLKIRITITGSSPEAISPEVQRVVANFTVSTLTLALVAPTSGTAFDLIQVYAKMCNYETGWDEFGTFFFRSRTVSGSAVAALDPWTNIISVDDTHPGYDRVANIGLVTATPYLYRYDYVSAGEPEPTSQRRFGPILRQLDFSSVLLANDVQIGLAAAQIAYQDNYRPKWRCRAQVKDMPWLQLSDPVDFTFATDPKMLDNAAGDPLQAPGFAGPQGVALAISKRMKIVGITRKMSACTRDLLLEEILS